ncbi:cytochrome c-type biogenesis protein CcmH [Luteitalea sp.]|jgi:cytochrome c-type biogenesis protein CcmH|uniref:cytochrome c-type biogenesis protein CcmH n=1 Tax=Luteitalea sp. TaxID=2004800 RepID=UPI0037C83999
MTLATLVLALAISPVLSGPDLEREARVVDAMLIAPCCFSQQVSVHQSPAADEVRRDVRRRLAEGQSRQQIVDAYVAQHGKRILAVPPAEGFDLTLHLMPLALLLASVGLALAIVRRFGPSTLAAAAVPGPPAGGSRGLEQRLDEELRDLD